MDLPGSGGDSSSATTTDGWHLSTPQEWTSNFRRVRHTTRYGQEVEMMLRPGEIIRGEIHPDNDQLFFVVAGTGTARLNNSQAQRAGLVAATRYLMPGARLYVDAGTWHELEAGPVGLSVVSIYMPWHHPPGTVHATNPEAVEKTPAVATSQASIRQTMLDRMVNTASTTGLPGNGNTFLNESTFY